MSYAKQNILSRPKRRSWTSRAVVMLPFALVTLILWTSPNYQLQSDSLAEPFGGDFIQEWVGGWIVSQGDQSRLYDLAYAKELQHSPEIIGFDWDHSSYLPMVYPPFYYLLISPLSMLPMPVAAFIWAVMMAACLAGTIYLLQHLYPAGGTILNWGVPLSLLFVPLIESLTSGQKSTLLLLLFTASFLLLKRQKLFWAGVVFGLVAFKPQLILVLCFVMLLKRQWSFLAGVMCIGTLLAGLSLSLGSDVCWQYFEFCTGMSSYVHTSGYDLQKSHCWWGACQLLLGWMPELVVKAFAITGSLLTCGLLARLLRGPFETDKPRFAFQFSGIILATLLVSPHLFTYDLTLLLLPMLLIVMTGQRSIAVMGRQSRFILTMGILLFIMGGLFAPLAASIGLQLSVLIMVALLWSLSQTAADQHSTGSNWWGAYQTSLQYD